MMLLLFAFCSLFAFAQQTVSGKIKDPKGQPLSGATVTVKGTSIATATSADGSFSITLPAKKK